MDTPQRVSSLDFRFQGFKGPCAIGNRSGTVLLTLEKHIMTIKNVKGPTLVHMLFWVGVKKKFPIDVIF